MKKKRIEKAVQESLESSLPSSNLSFEELSSSIDFSRYGQKMKIPLYKRKSFMVGTGGILAIMIASASIGILVAGRGYGGSSYGFAEGRYSFSSIAYEKGESSIEKPNVGDTITISSAAEGEHYFRLSKETVGYEGYFCYFGFFEKYEMTVKAESLSIGSFIVSFSVEGDPAEARFTGMGNAHQITLEIKMPKYSCFIYFS